MMGVEKCQAVSFPVWALNGLEEKPDLDEPHIDGDRIVGVSVYHGRMYADGIGAIVTSYDRQSSVVDGRLPAGGHQFDPFAESSVPSMGGPLVLAAKMAQRFADR